MKSLKKSVIAVVVIGTLSVAGMAFAQHHYNGQNGPVGPCDGPRQLRAQQWNGNDLPPAPQTGQSGPGAPCGCGQRGPMFERQPMWGQNFYGIGMGHQGFVSPFGQFRQRGMFAPNMPQGFCGRGFAQDRGPAFGNPEMRGPRGDQPRQRGRFSPDMPQEIRGKAVEAAKLRIDLEDVLSRRPLNREKALELNGQIGKLEQEIQAWRFERKLDRIEEFGKKSAPQTEKDAEKAE